MNEVPEHQSALVGFRCIGNNCCLGHYDIYFSENKKATEVKIQSTLRQKNYAFGLGFAAPDNGAAFDVLCFSDFSQFLSVLNRLQRNQSARLRFDRFRQLSESFNHWHQRPVIHVALDRHFCFSVVAISLCSALFGGRPRFHTRQIAKIYRIIYILPWVIPTVITLLMWQGLLETKGLINQILGAFGIPGVVADQSPDGQISTILVMVWFSFHYFMVIAFGYLKSIPKDYYEAAVIDGANKNTSFSKLSCLCCSERFCRCLS